MRKKYFVDKKICGVGIESVVAILLVRIVVTEVIHAACLYLSMDQL